MPNLTDLYRAKASATSRDRSVTAVMTLDGIRVRLAQRCLRQHDADSLSTAVRTALNGVISGWTKISDRLLPRDPAIMDSPAAVASARFLTALAELKVVVEHPVAKVGIHQNQTRVSITPDALRLPEDALSAQLNEAVADLMRAHRQRVALLHDTLRSTKP